MLMNFKELDVRIGVQIRDREKGKPGKPGIGDLKEDFGKRWGKFTGKTAGIEQKIEAGAFRETSVRRRIGLARHLERVRYGLKEAIREMFRAQGTGKSDE